MNRLKSKLRAMMLMFLFSAGVFAADAVTLDKATWPTDNSAEFMLNKKGDERKVSLTKEVAFDNDFVLEGTFGPVNANKNQSVVVEIFDIPYFPKSVVGTLPATRTNDGKWKVTIPKKKLTANSEYDVRVKFRNGTESVELTMKHIIVVSAGQEPDPAPGPIIVTPPTLLPPQ